MTNAELFTLRGEYLIERGHVEAWLDNGQPYRGTWVPELVGKPSPTPGSQLHQQLSELLRPGLLAAIFDSRVLGQHPDYPDDQSGTALQNAQALVETLKAQLAQLVAAL